MNFELVDVIERLNEEDSLISRTYSYKSPEWDIIFNCKITPNDIKFFADNNQVVENVNKSLSGKFMKYAIVENVNKSLLGKFMKYAINDLKL